MNSIPENVNSTIDDELVVRLFHQRVVVLGDQLDQSLGSRLCSQLLLLSADDSHKDISFWINSPGGSPSAMLAVYDTMRFISCDVATTCVGQAVGAAAVLLAGGTAGQRGILRHGRVVLHQPAIEGKGTIPDLIIHADEVLRVRALASRIRSACLRSIRLQLDRTAAGGANFCATPRVIWRRVSPRAPPTAARISDDGSLRPRSISDRYCGDTPACAAMSVRMRCCSVRINRRNAPSASRHSRSTDAGSASATRVRCGPWVRR